MKKQLFTLLSNIQTFLLYLFFFLVPLFFFNRFGDQFEFSKFVLMAILLSLLFPITAWIVILNKQYMSIPKKIVFVLGLWIIVDFVSAYFGVNRLTSFIGTYPSYTNGVLFDVLSVLLFIILSQLPESALKHLLKYFLGGLILSIVFWSYEYIFKNTPWNILARPNATQANAALYSLLPLLAFWVLLIYQKTLGKFKGIVLFLISLAILLSWSRSTWIAWVGGVITVGLLYSFYYREHLFYLIYNKKRLLGGAILLILITFLVFIVPISIRLKDLVSLSSNTSPHLRLLELKDAIQLIKNSQLWVGNGPASVIFSYPKFRSVEFNQTTEWNLFPNNIRSLPLDLIATRGVIGFLCFLTFLAIILWYGFKAKKVNEIGFLASLIIFLSVYYMSVTASIALFLVASLILVESSKKINFSINNKALKLILITVLLGEFMLLIFILKIIWAEIYFQEGLRKLELVPAIKETQVKYPVLGNNILFIDYSFSKSDLQVVTSAEDFILKAKTVNPFINLIYERQHAFTLGFLAVLRNQIEDLNKALEIVNQAIKENPHDWLSYSLRSALNFKLYTISSEKEDLLLQAIEDMHKVFILNPSSPLPLTNLGLMYWQKGDLDSAEKNFRQALLLKPDYIQNWYHLADVLLQKDQKDQAKNIYLMILDRNPEADLARNKLQK